MRRSLRTVATRALALVVGVGIGVAVVGPALGDAPPDDGAIPAGLASLPHCAGPVDHHLIVPSGLPYGFPAAFGLAHDNLPREAVNPDFVSVEPLPGGTLSDHYSGGPGLQIGGTFFAIFPLRFAPGDAGARVTVVLGGYVPAAYAGATQPEPGCVTTYSADIPALSPGDVRVRHGVFRRTVHVLDYSGQPVRAFFPRAYFPGNFHDPLPAPYYGPVTP